GIRSIFHSGIPDVDGEDAAIARGEQVGIGLSVHEYMARGLNNAPLANSYKTIPEHVLAAVGYTISSTSVEIEPVVYDEAMPNPWTGGTIAAGVCIGTRIIGKIDTLEGVTATVEIELRVFKKDEVEHVFW